MSETKKRQKLALALASVLCSCICTSSAFAAPPTAILKIKDQNFYYHSNRPLTEPNPNIETAVFVIHGSTLNGNTYYDTMEILANQAQKQDQTIIVSPVFRESPESAEDLVYDSEGWIKGDENLNYESNFKKVSSFDVIDRFVSLFSNPTVFPNLKKVVITGHSAGGQLTQRYAFSNQMNNAINERIHMQYIVLNPGSYLYLTKWRPYPATDRYCSKNYNDYKYGLDHRNEYASRVEVKKMIKDYLSRDITYAVGEADVDRTGLDNECGAQVQGPTRYERAVQFKRGLDLAFPGNRHQFVVVPGIGHSQAGMYRSEALSKIVFSITADKTSP